MKNKEIIPMLNGFAKIEKLKLGGIELKAILKNKKALMAAFEDLEVVRKKLIEDYETKGAVADEDKFTPENLIIVSNEWTEVSEAEADVVLIKLNSAKLDQISDITLEQMEVLESMAE